MKRKETRGIKKYSCLVHQKAWRVEGLLNIVVPSVFASFPFPPRATFYPCFNPSNRTQYQFNSSCYPLSLSLSGLVYWALSIDSPRLCLATNYSDRAQLAVSLSIVDNNTTSRTIIEIVQLAHFPSPPPDLHYLSTQHILHLMTFAPYYWIIYK